ncbi:MAG: M15 family metallopeptidase [Bacteroidia bacterium]|nr:M15 family metallopeptidase [Bacteroidia bacterium]
MFKRMILVLVFLTGCFCGRAQVPDDAHSQFQALPVYHVEARIRGVSYPEDCPVKLDDLRYLRLLYYGFDGEIHLGEMICNAAVAEDLMDIFIALFDAKYQLGSIRLIDDFGGDDDASMAADNTSCFNFRKKTGQRVLSAHALGMAVDINPMENPYVHRGRVLPPEGVDYADRSSGREHMIGHDDLCYKLFREKGFSWGGDWQSSKDYQHFEKAL